MFKKEVVRPYFIFYYCIFFWLILYMLRIIPFSPKFIIILGIIENIFILTLKIYNKYYSSIPSFLIINTIIKIIPLICVWNTTIKENDIIFSAILFIVYLIWLIINKKFYILYSMEWLTKNKKNKNSVVAPFEHFFEKIKLNFFIKTNL